MAPSAMVAGPELAGRVSGYRAFRPLTVVTARRRQLPT
jgi:hypothetical protein